LENLVKIKSLEISALKIGGFFGFLRRLVRLQQLWVESQDISDPILKEIAEAQNLKCLTLASKHVTGAGLANLSTLHNLSLMRLVGTNLGQCGFSELEQLANLDELWLENILLTGSIARSLIPLNLRSLHLSDGVNLDDDKVVDALCRCESLEDLWITTEISDERRLRLQKALPKCAI